MILLKWSNYRGREEKSNDIKTGPLDSVSANVLSDAYALFISASAWSTRVSTNLRVEVVLFWLKLLCLNLDEDATLVDPQIFLQVAVIILSQQSAVLIFWFETNNLVSLLSTAYFTPMDSIQNWSLPCLFYWIVMELFRVPNSQFSCG